MQQRLPSRSRLWLAAALVLLVALSLQIGAVAAQTNLLSNGNFSVPIGSPDGNWGIFPDDPSSYPTQIVGGVFQYRNSGTAGVVLQRSGDPIAAGAGVQVSLELGNSNSVFRRRTTVIAWDSNFSDLRVCTFWVLPDSPLQTRKMQFRTAQAWTNAQVSIYASSPDGNPGFSLLDNVSLHLDNTVPLDATICTDPLAPPASAGAAGSNLLNNGGFTSPITNGNSNWGIFPEDGSVVHQIASQIFNYYRTLNSIAGVVLQNTQQSVATNTLLEATFQLGNSTPTLQRVTVIVHEASFVIDLQVCTFWIPSGTPLATYTMKTFASREWSEPFGQDAAISFYASTTAASGWILLDSVTLRALPTLDIPGTSCIKENAIGVVPIVAPQVAPLAIPAPFIAPPSIDIAPPSEGSVGEGTSSE
ncbi:MAG: hypothetical protein SGI73_20390 [Chloroflexota bacterium]|nr:hypothetical protein [Chloroflexota bacterium]